MGFSIGLLAGWLTAFAIQVVISRTFLADQRRQRDEMGADPFLREALKNGRRTTITLEPKGPE
ncbi:MAG: hypothetical protein AAF196_09060 [Planctomycetota bacterium]